MAKQFRGGRIAAHEAKFIRENISKMGYQGVATHLGRKVTSIIEYCKRQGVVIDNKAVTGFSELDNIKAALTNESFWVQIKKQLTSYEQEYFKDQYAQHISQFERVAKVLHTEKMQVMHLIRNEILLDRCLARQREHMVRLEETNNAIQKLQLKDPIGNANEIRNLANLANTYSAAFSSFADEAKVIQDKINIIRKELRGTREQRTKNMRDANTSFSAYVAALEEEALREREGVTMNLFRAAMEKERARLLQWHTYKDGEASIPIMTPETILALKQDYESTDTNN